MHVFVRRSLARGAAAVAALALTAGVASAQAGVNPFGFGVSAGAAVPTGDLGDAVNTGFSVDGVVTLRVPAAPVSFRGEVGYTRFGFKNGDANLRLITGVANVVFAFPAAPAAVVRPYLIGGIGAYNSQASSGDVESDSETDFGFNGGFGVELPLSGFTGFGEVRFTSIRGDGESANFIPIRFGIRF